MAKKPLPVQSDKTLREDDQDASSEEQSSRAWVLVNEIDRKLAQARGICGAVMYVEESEIAQESLSAAEDIIEGAQKAFDELRGKGGARAVVDPSNAKHPAPSRAGSLRMPR